MDSFNKSDFESYLESYTQMRIGNKMIGCPYWSNKLENGKVTVRGFLNGKGEASDIRKHLETVYADELKKGLMTENTGDLLKLAKRERIGIDCSGLIYRLLSFLVKKEVIESFFPAGINKTNAATLTGKNHCQQIDQVENLLPGDLIRMMGGKHLLLVLANNAAEITYIHSSGKSRETGVHLGKIKYDPGKNSLKWLENTKTGENFGRMYFHPEVGDGFFRPFSRKPKPDIIGGLKMKNIHVVGFSGSEGSSILRFLIKNGIKNITAHDYTNENELEKNYKLWHKGMETTQREKGYLQLKEDLSKVKTFFSEKYLHAIEEAEIIFAPQSWRMYRINLPLKIAVEKGTPVYSMTRLYLELSKAITIGVTGTVGKGSTANIIYQVLNKFRKKVYFAGNETWKNQILDKITGLKPDDYLVLEISHRQLLDGVSKAPHITVVTNIYPNHQDEVIWKEYLNLKLLLPRLQKETDFAVLNYDDKELREAAANIKSNIVFYSVKDKRMNNNNIQAIYKELMSINSEQYQENIMAAGAVLILLGLTIDEIRDTLAGLKPLPARRERIGVINGVNVYDDIKSTTPWAVNALLAKAGKPVVLICGGDTKGIDYTRSIKDWSVKTKKIISLKSSLGDMIKANLPENNYVETDNLEEAVKLAVNKAGRAADVVISPGAAYFYSKFIKGKKSLRKIITSLLQEGPVSQD